MTRPFDISKFRKTLTKSITGISTGFNDPDTWISTGSYGLNYLISGDFDKGVPMGKVTVFAGESGAGKSYIVSGNIAKHAQEQGIFVVMIDTENALDEKWLIPLGVDTSEDKLLRISASMIDDVAGIVHAFVTDYKANHMDLPKPDRPKILFIIDSLGMLLTPTEVKQFEAADMKGDMGRKAKQLKAFVSNCVNMFGDLNMGMVVTNHTYASQDMFDPDDKISGGSGFMFASSIVIAMKKYKLKEDEDGNKTTGSDIRGIRATCKVVKTRYSKPFESIKIDIPWETGMNPTSGLFDLFDKAGKLVKEGNSYVYTSKITGKVIKQFKKAWNNDLDSMKILMDEFTKEDLIVVIKDNGDELPGLVVVHGD
jgi:recombination protein RecA